MSSVSAPQYGETEEGHDHTACARASALRLLKSLLLLQITATATATATAAAVVSSPYRVQGVATVLLSS